MVKKKVASKHLMYRIVFIQRIFARCYFIHFILSGCDGSWLFVVKPAFFLKKKNVNPRREQASCEEQQSEFYWKISATTVVFFFIFYFIFLSPALTEALCRHRSGSDDALPANRLRRSSAAGSDYAS